jgi:hypothetical protein
LPTSIAKATPACWAASSSCPAPALRSCYPVFRTPGLSSTTFLRGLLPGVLFPHPRLPKPPRQQRLSNRTNRPYQPPIRLRLALLPCTPHGHAPRMGTVPLPPLTGAAPEFEHDCPTCWGHCRAIDDLNGPSLVPPSLPCTGNARHAYRCDELCSPVCEPQPGDGAVLSTCLDRLSTCIRSQSCPGRRTREPGDPQGLGNKPRPS